MLEDDGDQNSAVKILEEKCINVENRATVVEKIIIQDRST